MSRRSLLVSSCALSRFAVAGVAWLLTVTSARAQLPYAEGFNTDGDGVRYTVGGRGTDFIFDAGGGPSYWEHNFNVGDVGVINKAPARWASLLWTHDIDTTQWTDDALDVFDATVNWASQGRATNLVTYMTPPPTTAADLFVRDRLVAAGHTVEGIALDAFPLPTAANARLILHASPTDVTPPTKFNAYAVPVITWNSSGLDDMGLTSIGAQVPVTNGQVKITDPTHPAAGGKSGTIQWTTDPQSLFAPGRTIAVGGKVVATFNASVAPTMDSLAKVDQLIAGQLGGTTATSTVTTADLAAPTGGNWPFNGAVPGAPGDGFAVRGLGQLTVDAAATYSFALSGDDGGRFRIDVDRNGQFNAADDVIVDDALHAFQDSFGSVALQTGNYDFEWVSFDNTTDFASEVSVAFNPGGGQIGPITIDNWTVLGDHLASDPVKLSGDIALTTYIPDVVLQERPALVVVDTGADLLGGRISGQEGTGFFAGADINEPSYGAGGDNIPRSLTLAPIDVTGETGLQITVAMAGTNIDFENNDFLRILADPDGEGPLPSVTVANFVGDDTKALVYQGQALGNVLEDFTFDLPAGATNLVIRFEAYSTFYNEILAFDNVRITSDSTNIVLGDTDDDRDVDITDLNNVRNNFSGTGLGDTDGDNDVDITDLNNVRNNFGVGPGANAVPEPATWALLAVGGLATYFVGRRRAR
ncbi:MAG: PEP-CTERM sorting domain-containing protein [Planctomycetia bacterium]|nr:PEP-CTERM sorting domain-containing protein [Planctomycetia bacterium]